MRLIWIYVAGAVCLPAMAQSLPALAREALENNREILAAQKRYEAARQRPGIESSLPDPTVSLGYTSNGYPWPGAGLGTAVTSNLGVMVSQEMPFPGKLKLRGEIASKEADAEFQQYLSVRLNVVARLKSAYHELHHAYISMEVIRRNQALLREFIRVAEARYSVGRAAQQDVFRAQTQYSILEAQLLRAQEEKEAKEAEILSLLNRPPGGPLERPPDTTPGPLKSTLEELYAHARTEAPALRREQKLVERSELAANLARKGYDPDYTISGGYFNQGGMPPMYEFRVDFKLPAYFWRKQRAEVAGQVSSLREARHNYEAAGQLLNDRIKEDYVTAQTASRLMDLYAKSVTPEARLALESSMASYETGALDALSVLTNLMTVVDYELNYHEEMMRFYLAVDRLEEMTGLELDQTGEVTQ
jgi:cobalt-zinc-cadmium efflux system outer membrane protein